jgi:hypothetical protein
MVNQQVRDGILIAETACILSALIWVMSPARVSASDVFRAAALAALISVPAFYWFSMDGDNEFKSSVKAVCVGAVADWVLFGLVKLLMAFKRNPLGTIKELRK